MCATLPPEMVFLIEALTRPTGSTWIEPSEILDRKEIKVEIRLRLENLTNHECEICLTILGRLPSFICHNVRGLGHANALLTF